MPDRRVLIALSAALVLAVLVPGCAINASAAHGASEGTTKACSDGGGDDARDLRLFGAGTIAQDITFEGKAAINIQQHTTASEGADFDPSIDPTGKQLVFGSTRHSRHSHLYVKSAEGSAITQITDGNANDAQPVFAPDGKRIAFASDRAGQWDIWLIDVSGRNPMQITNGPMAELHPTWSPDGKRLAYCRINPKESTGELWIVELENPGTKRLIGEGLFPSWSPKGDKIAFQRARHRGSRWFSIWTITFENGEPSPPTEVLSGSQFAFIAPAWSADGTQLAFACITPSMDPESHSFEPRISGNGRADIAIVDADGRGMIRLTNGRGENYSPTWSVDDRIYFTAKIDNGETIWSVKPFRPSAMPVLTGPAPINRHSAQAAEKDSEP